MNMDGFYIVIIVIAGLILFFALCLSCGDYIQGRLNEFEEI